MNLLKKIPEGYIEDADVYKLMPMDTYNVIDVGGRIMFNMVVRDQMTIDNIVATTGLVKLKETKQKTLCIIIVSYTEKDVLEKIGNAKRLAGKLIDEGGEMT